MENNLSVRHRIPLLIAGFASLFFASFIGLLRMGISIPFHISPSQIALHGPLMVCGFLGTVISMERAVALGRLWAYLGPIAAAMGALSLIFGFNQPFGIGLITLASLTLSMASIQVVIKQREWFSFLLFLAALSWLVGCLLWFRSHPLGQVVPWWIGFLVITIAAERLELSRFLRPSRLNKGLLLGFIFLLGLSLVLMTTGSLSNFRLMALTLFLMAAWLLKNDVVRITIKQHGLTRYIAVALIAGYLWLLVASLIGLSTTTLLPASSYDAFIHAIFLGFGFSMIFGHALVIFPAIVKIQIPFNVSFYLPLFTLHLSMVLRMIGDFLYLPHLRQFGGALNMFSIIFFIIVVLLAVIIDKLQKNSAHAETGDLNG